uniref:Sleeping Beauty transposase HTH domain-containing protein n=1 Tax=Oncorhynchus tshawytscha TaxID=74940 RepID=A0AAZ3SFX4_ONCTS
MTQVIFTTIVYRQIISLIIHCITIPVGQKFTYTKLTVIALEASDGLIDINCRCTCGCISRPTFRLSASFLFPHHGKIKLLTSKSGSFLGAISKCLKVPHSSVQTIVRKYKHHGTTQPSYSSGRRSVLSPRDERTAKDLVKMQEETGTKVSISTVKRVLYINIT